MRDVRERAQLLTAINWVCKIDADDAMSRVGGRLARHADDFPVGACPQVTRKCTSDDASYADHEGTKAWHRANP